MKKIEQIVREEQNRIGVQEILMPTVRPVYPETPRIHVAQWRGTKLFSAMNSETCFILVESGVAAVLHHLSYSLGDVRAGATLS